MPARSGDDDDRPWALNAAADPPGPKSGPEHRVLHQHLCGRSPCSSDPSWAWGESPFFPAYADRLAWSRGKRALLPEECVAVVVRIATVLRDVHDEPHGPGLGAVCDAAAIRCPPPS